MPKATGRIKQTQSIGALLEKIEDEYDLTCYEKAVEEYELNPKTYTLEEVKKELDLD